MAPYLLLCLILLDGFSGVAMGSTNAERAPTPSTYGEPYRAEAPMARKLGKHRHKVVKPSGNPPLLAPQPGTTMQSVEESSGGDPTSSVDVSGHGQEVRLEMQHSSVDKSIAGGGVILGGLATMFLVAVFCYIRATGRHKLEAKITNSEISS